MDCSLGLFDDDEDEDKDKSDWFDSVDDNRDRDELEFEDETDEDDDSSRTIDLTKDFSIQWKFIAKENKRSSTSTFFRISWRILFFFKNKQNENEK